MVANRFPLSTGHYEDEDADISTKPVKVLSGGDYLTFERNKETQAMIEKPKERLIKKKKM